jgi:menaquinone-dependent protoporphyrinogen IX oxidase
MKVAEAIFGALSCEKKMAPMDDTGSLEEYDLVFIGFPVMQFGAPQAVRKFFKEVAVNKNIALFVTHAMPSSSDNEQQRKMLEKELEKCRGVSSGNELLGFFHCQGELSEKMYNELIDSNIPMLMEFAAMRPQTLGHPTLAELDQARDFALALVAP